MIFRCRGTILYDLAFNINLIISFKLCYEKKLLIISVIFLVISATIFLSGEFKLYVLSSQKWYYFPTHRAFELLFGCCLAIFLNNNLKTSINNKLALNILSIIAIIMMIIPIFFNVSFP